jgi:hypothetical protein
MIRIEKYPSRADKDAIMQKDIDRIQQLLGERLKPYTSKKMTPPKALKDFQWQIEELHAARSFGSDGNVGHGFLSWCY